MYKLQTILALVLAFVAIIIYYRNNYELSPVVHTKSGSLQGIVSFSRSGREFYSYFGIPYAKPPLGSLRFQPPEPVDKWDGILQVKSYASECLQADIATRSVHGSEDCLALNAFIPKLSKNERLLPVMVWFHGGAFAMGSANLFGPDYFMDDDVILVMINYRLGILGFLNTGDGVVRGNMGLKDQRMALQWIQANVKSFGGNSNQVTIFGESAGAISVHHHMLSPGSSGLFQKSISQSGTAVAKWSTRENTAEQAKIFSMKVGCPTESSKEMVKCLNALDGDKLVGATYADLTNLFRDPITMFGPSFENIKHEDAFITELPSEILRRGELKPVPWICGITSEEGLVFATPLLHGDKLSTIRSNVQYYLPKVLWQFKPSSEEELHQIVEYYFAHEENIDAPDKFQNWTNLLTDGLFAASAQRAINQQSAHAAPVYAYYYSYKGVFSLTDYLLAIQGKYHPILEYLYWLVARFINQKVFGIEPHHYGACHFDEVVLLFPFRLYSIKTSDKDYEISKKMIKTWVQFASSKSIKELESLNFDGVKWPPGKHQNGRTSEPLKYMQIDTEVKLINEPNPERNSFWNNLKS